MECYVNSFVISIEGSTCKSTCAYDRRFCIIRRCRAAQVLKNVNAYITVILAFVYGFVVFSLLGDKSAVIRRKNKTPADVNNDGNADRANNNVIKN